MTVHNIFDVVDVSMFINLVKIREVWHLFLRVEKFDLIQDKRFVFWNRGSSIRCAAISSIMNKVREEPKL